MRSFVSASTLHETGPALVPASGHVPEGLIDASGFFSRSAVHAAVLAVVLDAAAEGKRTCQEAGI